MVADPSAGLALGPVRALQLLHRRARAGHRRHRDRLLARRGHGPRAGGPRPPDRGRPLDPADPRPHRPRRRRARPVGAHRPARAGRHPRGRRAAAALAARPRRRVPRRAPASTCTTPTARRSRRRRRQAVISGEMEPTMLVQRRRDAVPRRGRHRLGARHPGPHGRAPSPTSSTARTTSSSATPCRSTGPPTASPATRTRAPTAPSLEHLRDVVRPRHLYLGHPYRTRRRRALRRRARPRAGAGGAPGEPGHRGPRRRRRRRCLRDGLQETDSAYSPFARVAEELGYTGDPTLEPSPFFTTLHGYRTAVRTTMELSIHG